MADATMNYPWSVTTRPRSIMDDLMEHEGKRIRMVLNTSGAQRIHGELKKVYIDGVALQTFEGPIAYVLASSIATVEVVKNGSA